MNLRLIVHSLSYFLLALSTQSLSQTRTYTPQDLPREILNAVKATSYLDSSFLQSDLKQATSGYVLLGLQLETLNEFYIYEDSVIIEALEDPSLEGHHWKLTVEEGPESQSFLDPVSKKLRKGFRGQSLFRVKAELSGSLSKPFAETYKLPMRVRFQACSTKECLLPAWLKLETPLATPSQNPPQGTSWTDSLSLRFAALLKEGSASLWELSLLLVLAGLLTAFTPCVYPLYPITLGIFGRWEKTLHFPAFFLALSYCAGITLSYASLGIFTLLSGALFASITQTPAFLITIGILMLISALSFSGLIQFPVPGFLQRASSHIGEGSEKRGAFASLAGAFGMGSSLGIVASPCVGPILVALLAWLSSSIAQGSVTQMEGFFLLAAFGAGMSLPFLVLGHLILRMKIKVQLGRFTPWMKYLGTVLLLASSLFFLVPGVRLLLGNEQHEGAPKFTFPIYQLEGAPKGAWKVLDFRADWCTACLQLEHETFASPEVAKEFESGSWAYVQVDFTNMGEREQKQAEDYKVLSLPTVLFLSPDDKICVSQSLHAFEKPDDFLKRLQNARTQCQ